ncbi:MAG: hypothetical protein GY898_23550, partial [Proteobacteria bacterium]|nr:hypothetical protein [Pseudomonadota bacterium]
MSVILTGATLHHEGWLAGIFELEHAEEDRPPEYLAGHKVGRLEQRDDLLWEKLAAAVIGGDVLIS